MGSGAKLWRKSEKLLHHVVLCSLDSRAAFIHRGHKASLHSSIIAKAYNVIQPKIFTAMVSWFLLTVKNSV